MGGAVFLSCCFLGMRCLALEPAVSSVELGLVLRWITLGELMLINIP